MEVAIDIFVFSLWADVHGFSLQEKAHILNFLAHIIWLTSSWQMEFKIYS